MAEANSIKIVRLETQMAEVKEQVKGVDDKVTRLDAKNDERFNSLDKKIDAKFDTLIENLDKRYAPKLAGTIIYIVVGAAALAVLYALIALVVFPNQFGTTKPDSTTTNTTVNTPSDTSGGGTTSGSTPSTSSSSSTTTTPAANTPAPSGGASVSVPLPQLIP